MDFKAQNSTITASRNICKGRPVPEHLRAEIWQICLNVEGKADSISSFDGFFDMAEQSLLRSDCTALVDKLGNDEEDKVSVVSDLESIITFYCKSRNVKYSTNNGWLDILQPLLSLKLSKAELYNCFYAIVAKYIPQDCVKNGKPFHLFRLLLQYHDPEIASYLDTKRITPDSYIKNWFTSLFASACDLKVITKMWDVYFQHSDPFLIFFMSLVILVNARDIILLSDESKPNLIETMSMFPSGLEADDIEDFCALAQYYYNKTPQSFKWDYQSILFGNKLIQGKSSLVDQASQALCLPVSISELLEANQQAVTEESVRYFVVDCRPAEQYNNGHLSTAFHLDANLMLQNPVEFNTAVHALFAAQQMAIAAGSVAGGEHLCFMGSGREEEDQYVFMVIAHFLQKGHQYICSCQGGFAALHEKLKDNLSNEIADHNAKRCIVCNPDSTSSTSELDNTDDFKDSGKDSSLFGKLSNVMKSKSAEYKEKLTNYIKNDQISGERHVSNTDKVGKRYRNMASVFTIGDDEEGEEGSYGGSSDDEPREVVSLETWLHKPDLIYHCKCKEIKANGYMYPSYMLIVNSHLYLLREIPKEKNMVYIQSRRALGSIVKITSKKRHPELITFKYGTSEDDGLKITDMDRFLIPTAGDAMRIVKSQIMKVLDALDS
ncbi:hypothetical protein LOTGIDRAFT_229906 [Lottia gigantea]|uniref:TBC1 domain family member 23 n=1 Tax=Lottia gigantea TaxID=225164 RepID=V4BFV4_LOTGI|nr:hypothetical protein LOTGIDRAFT_229906 [Lottia gigantea]ESP04792.1 hypothetical protein LOTGIDRAFT_229906 [Lottia gigantea]